MTMLIVRSHGFRIRWKERDMMKTWLCAGVLAGLCVAGVAQTQTVCGTWQHSPTPNPSESSSRLLGIAAFSPSDVWAVGEYDSLAGTVTPTFRAIAIHWNGSTWSTVSSPSVGPSGTTLTGVAGAASNDVWAVGYSNTYGSPQTLAQRWNGSAWSVVASPVITGGSSLEAITSLSATDLWAVGNRSGALPDPTTATLTTHWNGSAWSVVPSPNVANRWNDLAAVSASGPNDVWAVGSSRTTAGLYQNLVLHWNGSVWSVVPTPNVAGSENELAAVAAIRSNDAWAIGHTNDGITLRSVFMHWDGSAWSNVSGPGGGLALTGSAALVALASDDVWAVGSTLAHWDGSTWSLAPNPVVPGTSDLRFLGASRLGPCDVWAAGAAVDAGGQHTLAAHLTPGGGTINQPPIAAASASITSGLAPLTVDLSSAGSQDIDGSIVSYLWDFGDSSYPVDRTQANPTHTYIQTGPLTYHAVVTVIDDRGAAATASVTIHIDDPTHVESQAVTRVHRNGSWKGEDAIEIRNASGQPVAGAVVTATYSGPSSGTASGTTDALGLVTLSSTAGGQSGSEWCFTVSGVTSAGTGYEPTNNAVTTQCESGALGVQQGAAPGSLQLSAGPNPFAASAGIHLALSANAAVSVQVLDPSGRLVRELLHGELPAGGHDLTWDGREAHGMKVPAGMYFVRVVAGTESRCVRLLRLQ
jgi:hypothetical protein